MKMFYSLTVGTGTSGTEDWVRIAWNWVLVYESSGYEVFMGTKSPDA